MRQLFTYILIGVIWLITLPPLFILYGISFLLYILTYYIVRYRSDVVRNNLIKSFPNKSKKDIISLEKKFYRHFTRLFVETPKMLHYSRKHQMKHCNVTNPEILEKYYKQNRNIVALMSHYGSWEIGVNIPNYTSYKCTCVYKPLSNKKSDKIIKIIRSKAGMVFYPMAKILRYLTEMKIANTPTFTIFLADQSPSEGELDYFIDFLNQRTPVYTGFERIAKKFNSIVIYIDVQKRKKGYYNITFIEITENPNELEKYEITNRYNKLLEKIIQENPAYWLWSHKRWKHTDLEKPMD
ncbi:MAG: hypothetical protein CVT98_10165 [Bacteroidetes bacterium HGW-Bacteroidetes-15]|nr:MAG: hypothetical protein CVT98_10165 [Bacteroidetes bacterium HGW-Bacteroidetes-15]